MSTCCGQGGCWGLPSVRFIHQGYFSSGGVFGSHRFLLWQSATREKESGRAPRQYIDVYRILFGSVPSASELSLIVCPHGTRSAAGPNQSVRRFHSPGMGWRDRKGQAFAVWQGDGPHGQGNLD